MTKNENLLTGNVRSLFLQYLIPCVGGMLGTALYVLGDTIIVGRALGGQGLAAINLTLPVFKIINSTALMFGIGGATALAVSRGQGRDEQANDIFNISMYVSILFGIIFTLIRVFFLDELTLLLGATDFTFDMVRSYLGVYMFFALATILNLSLSVFIRNDGSPKLVMNSMLVSSALNIILDYVFVFPMGLGMWGAALATGISPVVGTLILLAHFTRGKSELHFQKVKMNFNYLRRIVRNGFPSFIVEISVGLVIFLFNYFILKIQGDIGISAYGIIANLTIIFTAIFTGIGQTIQPIVSINHGAKQEDRIFQAIKYGNITALIAGVIFYMIGFFFPAQLAGLFTSETGLLIDITSRGIKLYFLSFIFSGVNITMTSYIQSKEEPRISTFISLLRGSIYIVALLLILPKRYGLDGIWFTVPIAEILTLITYTVMFKDCRNAFKYMFTKQEESEVLILNDIEELKY